MANKKCFSFIQANLQSVLAIAVDARVPPGPAQQAALQAYSAAAELLSDWENGVPLDARGVEILERCLECFEGAGAGHFAAIQPPL